jgi:hypothetical protein
MPLEICHGFGKQFRVFLQQPECGIARATQKATDYTGRMIVVDVKASIIGPSRGSTNRAGISQRLILRDGQPVQVPETVGSPPMADTFTISRPPCLMSHTGPLFVVPMPLPIGRTNLLNLSSRENAPTFRPTWIHRWQSRLIAHVHAAPRRAR